MTGISAIPTEPKPMQTGRLSIVTTVYRSAPFIREFYRRCIAAAQAITPDFEIVFVNDGSPDDSLQHLIELHRQDSRVIIVDLSRNFGHHRAVMAGLQHAKGDFVFSIDVDLEEDPGDLTRFWQRLRQEHCDVVYGVQKIRRGGFVERVVGNAFYAVLRWVSQFDIPPNLTTMRLMTRRYVNSLIEHREREMILSGLWILTGYEQIAEEIEKRPRTHKSNYPIGARIKFAVDHFTSFSNDLLYKVLYAGIAIFLVSFAAMLCFSLYYIITGAALAGWTSLAASIWMFGGLQTLLIGLVGIYVGHIFRETKNRPYVIVRDLYRRDARSNELGEQDIVDVHKVVRRY